MIKKIIRLFRIFKELDDIYCLIGSLDNHNKAHCAWISKVEMKIDEHINDDRHGFKP